MKKIKFYHIVPFTLLASPFLTLHVHKAYKAALEENWILAWPDIPINSEASAWAAGLLLFSAGFSFVMGKYMP